MQNGLVESVNSRIRDGLLKHVLFFDLVDAALRSLAGSPTTISSAPLVAEIPNPAPYPTQAAPPG